MDIQTPTNSLCLQRLVRTVGKSSFSLSGYCLPPGAGTMKSFIMYVFSRSNRFSSIDLDPISFFCLLQRVVSLSLTVQSTTFAGQQSLLIWERQPVDGSGALDFNLRFVRGADQEDAGMAASEVHASSSQQSGSVRVVFPDVGYVDRGISARILVEMVKLGLMESSLSMSEFFLSNFTSSSGYMIK